MSDVTAAQSAPSRAFTLIESDAPHVESLPPHFRVVIQELAKGGEYRDVAVALNLPIGTVKSRINRARKQIERKRAEVSALGGTH